MSWNGTVRCGHCYKSGHNKRGCPEIKKKIAADPNCWEAQHGAGKPRQCSYCDKSGHNRKTCPPRKTHEALYRSDNQLWRRAFEKWAVAEGLGYGALISAPVHWRDTKGNSHDGKVKPALGMFMAHNTRPEDNALTYLWAAIPSHRDYSVLTMELIGGEINDYYNSARQESLQLPDIPVISPATGVDHWGHERSRDNGDAKWTVVSPSPRPGFGDEFTQSHAIDLLVKDYFKGGKDAKTERDFRVLDTKVRKALKDYVNDSATLEELDARLNPATDDNSDSETQ